MSSPAAERLLKRRRRLEALYTARAHPQWTARYAERRTDELRARRPLLKLYGAAFEMLGPIDELARLGQRLWERAGAGNEKRRAVKKVLAEELVRRLQRGGITEVAAEASEVFIPIARRSQESILAVVGVMVKGTGVTGWVPDDVVFTEGMAELTQEVTGYLEKSIVEGYAQDVAAAVVRAADPAKPLPMPDIARQIRNEALGITRKKAMTIARTETARVYGANALTAMQRNGLPRRRWLTAAGSPAAAVTPVCPYCEAMAAQGFVDVNEPITTSLLVGTREPKLTRVSAQHPPYHPNCRCDIAADTEGWLPPAQ